MKRICVLTAAVFAALLLTATVSLQADEPVPQDVTKTIELFNGKDLSGWYVFLKERQKGEDPNKVFSVQDGMIRISGQEYGGIVSEQAYKNYHVIVEFKWGEKTWGTRVDKARDSGLLVHSFGEDGAFGKCWMYSIEANIIEGGIGDFIVVGDGGDRFSLTAEVAAQKSTKNAYIWQKGGKPVTISRGRVDWFNRDPQWDGSLGYRGKNEVEKPHGQWNKLELIADGDNITVILNGVTVNQASKVKPNAGRIQLQTEMAELFIRRVTLQPVKK
ncbi:MAG: DUF1080 domain-containing protein [Thermoguttaceae bacterium]|nr:DUF1080 domain-containing protein [Thermoguttaceae bacterium]